MRSEYEKSPLHTIVYGGTGTGRYFKLYIYQDLDQDRRSVIIVCKDERDWINPKTGKPFTESDLSDTNMITSKNMPNFIDR